MALHCLADSTDLRLFVPPHRSYSLTLQLPILSGPFSCLRDTSGTSKSFETEETLNNIEESRRARLEGRTRQYRELKREAVRAVRRDKEAQVRGVCETVDSHF